jgi:hypothetical protein
LLAGADIAASVRSDTLRRVLRGNTLAFGGGEEGNTRTRLVLYEVTGFVANRLPEGSAAAAGAVRFRRDLIPSFG